MKVWIRNLTKDIEKEINLPMDERELDKVLNPNDEYIILDSEILKVDEYESIDSLNEFLFVCEENGVSLEDLEILSALYFYNEVKEMVNNQTYMIIDFDAETSSWCNGNGGDFCNSSDKGMCLFDSGMYNPFGFEMTEEIYDWIDWESVWINAETEGWQAVGINRHGYLVHR